MDLMRARGGTKRAINQLLWPQYGLTSMQQNQPLAGLGQDKLTFSLFTDQQCTSVPQRSLSGSYVCLLLPVAELGTPVLSEGASDVACTASKNSAVLGNTEGIHNRDLFVPTQKMRAQSALEARDDLQI